MTTIEPKNEKKNTQDNKFKKLEGIFKYEFKDQAIFFLDHYVPIHNNMEASEIVFQLYQKCCNNNNNNKGYTSSSSSVYSNSSISELKAHIALEFIGKAVTQTEFRNYIHNIDPNMKTDIPLIIILLFYFDIDWKEILDIEVINGIEVARSKKALQKAQEKLEEVIIAEKKASKEADEANQAMKKAHEQEVYLTDAIAKRREEEEALVGAKLQADEALARVNQQTNNIYEKRNELENIIMDEANGIVTRNRAKAELRIIDNDDPLPLRKAKIHNENALKYVRKRTHSCVKAIGIFEEAKKNAEQAHEEARLTKEKAIKSEKDAEANKVQARDAITELKQILYELSNAKILPWGHIFFIERELKEAERFLPKQKLKEYKQKAIEEKKDL